VHLWLRPFETQARFTFLHVRPFATASPWLLRPRLTSRSTSRCRPFGREARSPQVRTPPFPARPPDLRRSALAIEASRSFARSPPLGSASYPVPVRQPAVSLTASSPRSVTLPRLRFASVAMACFREDLHLQGSAHAGRTIGIGAPGYPGDPCHTTRHAGPHRAVREVVVTAEASAAPSRRSIAWLGRCEGRASRCATTVGHCRRLPRRVQTLRGLAVRGRSSGHVSNA